MHLKTRNVNTAFRELVTLFHHKSKGEVHSGDRIVDIVKSSSRNGPVFYIPEPVTITYTHPRDRVLFNKARDANPFFHLYESLWMLAGRNDVAPLKYYVSTIDQFSDDGVTFNGAYGDRWRHAKRWSPQSSEHPDGTEAHWSSNVDQLKLIIEHLRAKPDSRRAVLHMSNVEDDLLKMDTTKDQCCNLVVTFAIRQAHGYTKDYPGQFLDMTVFNRSNDMIWGMLGANVVHFSMLQEYMAACIGVEVGHYHQITNNLHVYEWNFKPEEWWTDETTDWYLHDGLGRLSGPVHECKQVLLVKDPATFDREVVEFVERHRKAGDCYDWNEPFLRDVAQWVCIAFHWHRFKRYDLALDTIVKVEADDWRIACTNWLLKRKENYGRKSRQTD